LQDERSDTPVPGDLIWIRRRQWRVRSAHRGDGLTRLLVDGWAPAESRSFLIPCDRWSRNLARRHRRVSLNRALAWLAASTARAHPAWTPGSIVDSRSSILAYQLEPALAMLAGKRRILIADEVGLGKTIQAALMIAETLRRSADARILVIAPASLLVQWNDELRARFGIAARLADADSLTRLRSDRLYLRNPWRSPGVWLASPDYVKQPHVLDAIPALPFDLVVIDEAHIMAGDSQRRAAVDALGTPARHVVLMTATPHDGDNARFNRLISLAATGSSADALTVFRRTRTSSVRNIRRLDVAPGVRLLRVLAGIDAFERSRRTGPPSEALALICGVLRKRAVSSLAALTSSLERRLAIVERDSPEGDAETWSQPGLGFDERPDDGDVMTSDEWRAMTAASGLSGARERTWLKRLVSLVTRGVPAGGDPKIAMLSGLLRRSREPVVIFTEYRDSLLAIAEAVVASRRVAVLHGGLTGVEQRRALAAFVEGEADALLATDVASQGLNLQHRTRWIVHFDLPWTPMRLEQRVGRVDRIGQSRRVHVTSIGVRHPAQEALRQRMAKREEMRDRVALPGCRRWTRAAEGLAQLFARQRTLAARWRGPDPVAVPRARSTAAGLRRLGLDPCSPVTLVEVPFISGTGEVLERWIGWTGARPAAPSPALQRRVRALSARARRRHAAWHATQAADARRSPHQPGLFEARDVTNPIDDAHPAEVAPDLSVRIGEPQLLLILE